jgi:hypothetical protein
LAPEGGSDCASANRGTAELEDIFGTNISNGHLMTSIEFDAELLSYERPTKDRDRYDRLHTIEASVPRQDEILSAVESVVELALHDGYPRIDWVAAKLHMAGRAPFKGFWKPTTAPSIRLWEK